MVYVLNIKGKPLMPTENHAMIRRMLSCGKASVIKLTPFTIKLNYETTEYKQAVSLGIDAGTGHIGLSATTEKKELYAGEVLLRIDIVDLISTRREMRRSRRSRKTRYRQPRWQNRVASKKPGWVAPSVRNKIDTHIRTIQRVMSILPITKTTIEVAQFNTQLIKNPDISGEEYQQGEQLGFWNTREYVLARDGHECQFCHGKSGDKVLNVHHIESRKIGGDSPDNLITLCETCHHKIHKEHLEHKFKRKSKSLRDTAVMGIMRWKLYEEAVNLFDNVHLTYGYITKHTRIENGLDKTHAIDARCISGNPLAKPLDYMYLDRQIRRHNRQIHKMTFKKGKRALNQAPYEVKGFRLFDKVKYKGQECVISGRRLRGSFVLRDANYNKLHDEPSYKKLRLREISRGVISAKVLL